MLTQDLLELLLLSLIHRSGSCELRVWLLSSEDAGLSLGWYGVSLEKDPTAATNFRISTLGSNPST